MATSTDWVADDMNATSLPAIVSPSDLFDGELFGDELIDIYNSTVDDHDQSDEIARLLDSKKGEDADEMLASMDDGFGTFRPSTSFNDFSSLLAAEAPVVVDVPAESAIVVAEVPSSAGITITEATKKRAAPAPATAPSSPKRSKPVARRVSAVTKKEATSSTIASTPAATAVVSATTITAPTTVTTSPATKKAATKPKPGEKKSTPNPLTTTSSAALVRTKDVAPIPKHITTIVTKAIAPVPAEVPSSNIVVPKKEESDFNEMVANASASALIANASGGTDADVPVETVEFTNGEKVDTSTAHIKALTGNNWVAACAGSTQCVASVASDLDDSKSGCNRNRRQNLTPDERARQNRDRNREHARNTRLRKKAYVEELKRTLTELVSQRDAADFEKRQAAQRELEQREVRFRVIEEFLKLRGRNETNFARWAAILEDGFALTLPVMDFRKIMQGSVDGVKGMEQVLNGVSDVMADANVFSEFLQTLGRGEGTVSCQFQCDRKNFFMDGCQAVLEWTATSVGAIRKGASAELVLKGAVRGKFSPASNKLLSAHVTCDTGAVLMQLQKLLGNPLIMADPICFDAAQVAACQADAILDSLEMPCLPSSSVPTSVMIVNPSSDESCGKGETDSDDSIGEPNEKLLAMEKGLMGETNKTFAT